MQTWIVLTLPTSFPLGLEIHFWRIAFMSLFTSCEGHWHFYRQQTRNMLFAFILRHIKKHENIKIKSYPLWHPYFCQLPGNSVLASWTTRRLSSTCTLQPMSITYTRVLFTGSSSTFFTSFIYFTFHTLKIVLYPPFEEVEIIELDGASQRVLWILQLLWVHVVCDWIKTNIQKVN